MMQNEAATTHRVERNLPSLKHHHHPPFHKPVPGMKAFYEQMVVVNTSYPNLK